MPGSNGRMNGWLDVPARSPKPRTAGLTHVIDKGMNLRDIEGLFDTAGEYVDIVKLGWGTSYVTNNLEKKIALYRSFETPVVCGGTLFEAAVARDRLDEYRRWLTDNRLAHVEVSDGTIELPHERKLELIADLAQRLHRPLGGRLEGRGRGLRAVPVGRVDARRARRRRLEGDHRGPRGRHGGDLPADRRDAHRPDRRDRPRDRRRGHHLRGAHEGLAGVVRPPVRARGEPREHPARGGHPARDAPPRAPRRHAEGGPAS